ncbi:MAG: hypothetical protein AB7U64_20410, partial [Blastocatellales bacterium]
DTRQPRVPARMRGAVLRNFTVGGVKFTVIIGSAAPGGAALKVEYQNIVLRKERLWPMLQ